jgi:hypothetical protein
MPAERFRGCRIKSQSSRNKLIEKKFGKSPAMPGFLFFAPANFAAGNFRIFDASCRQGHNDERLTQAAASNGRRWRRSIGD